MIKVLLIESDPKTRDIITVGLDQFQVFDVDHAEDAWGVEMAREGSYDLMLVNLELGKGVDGLDIVKEIREFDDKAEIVLITRGRSSKLLSKEKAAQNIFALLTQPVEEQPFFKLLARVRERIEQKQAKR
ncbi:MAG: response regulator [Planctomycetota bacterium]|jgi:DNA-binding response OmpR family regulator